jgi:hypothetical protein
MVEGHITGLAAWVVALQIAKLDRVARRTNRLDIEKSDQFIDIALTDAGIHNNIFLASHKLYGMCPKSEKFG